MSTDDTDAGRETGGDAPLTRREMKAQGIQLTTEIPVVPTVDLAGGAGPAVHANRAGRDRLHAGRAVTETGGSAAALALPVADGEGSTDAPTSTGRRPVVRAPLTARGIRTVDESGEITSVQAAVGPAGEAPTSPTSWESAAALPAVALGIEDVAGRPAQAPPISPPGGDVALPEVPDREQAERGDVRRPTASADARTQEPERVEPPERTLEPPQVHDEGAAQRPAADRPAPPAPSPVGSFADRAPDAAAVEPPPRHDPRRAAVRVAVILAVLVALAVLGYLFYTGAFDGGATGGGAADVTGAAAAAGTLRGLAPCARRNLSSRHPARSTSGEEPRDR